MTFTNNVLQNYESPDHHSKRALIKIENNRFFHLEISKNKLLGDPRMAEQTVVDFRCGARLILFGKYNKSTRTVFYFNIYTISGSC